MNYSTRKDAVQHEIELHQKYDVKTNDEYYNKSNQTSIGYDTTGTTLSDEHKHKLSVIGKGRPKSEEHKRKIAEGNKNLIRSEETIRRIRESHISLDPVRSDEWKYNISETKKDTILSDEHKKHIGDGLRDKKQKKVICPHCGKEGGSGAMHLWHFNNCKFKIMEK